MLKICSLIPLALALAVAQGCGRERWSDNALQYNAFNRSKIHLSPMVTLVDDELTMCSWVKKMLPGNDNFWAFYGTPAYPVFHLSDDLRKVKAFNTTVLFNKDPEVPMNEWFHTCLSWNGAKGEALLYLNGEQIGTAQTARDAAAPADSELFLNWCPNGNTFFGGELFKLQFYKKALSGDQVSNLHNQGICSDVDQLYMRDMTLPWEYFILHEKYRFNVQLVPVECAGDQSAWNLLYRNGFLGKDISDDMVEEMKGRWELLKEFTGHVIDESLIEHLINHHDF